jgi:hypothetical protein
MAVAIGQQYQDIAPGLFGRSGALYQVQEIFRAVDGVDYARIALLNDPGTVKTLAAAVLEDRRRFRRMA